jgi:hypothetical protein
MNSIIASNNSKGVMTPKVSMVEELREIEKPKVT